jgi:hypothetical protein
MKKILLISGLVISITNIMAQSILLTEAQYKNFIPIDPITYTTQIDYFDNEGAPQRESIQKLVATNKKNFLLGYLNDMVSLTVVTTLDNGVEVKYLANSFADKKRNYTLYSCWYKCRTMDVLDGNNNKIAEVLLGVGVKVKAEIRTKEKNLNIADILSASASLSRKNFFGTLSIYTTGISGKETNAISFSDQKFDESTAWNALKQIELMKLKIYDNEVTIEPKIVAIKPLNTGNEETPKNTLETIRAGFNVSSNQYQLR